MFGLLNLAMADGYVATFKVKYDLLLWRPVTAIRLGGHRRQRPDHPPTRGWKPLREVPPIPDHDSGHAVEGGAAAAALGRVLRDGRAQLLPLQLHGRGGHLREGHSPLTRHYTSLSQAAEENARSTSADRLPLPARDHRRARPRHGDRRAGRGPGPPAAAVRSAARPGSGVPAAQRARRPAAYGSPGSMSRTVRAGGTRASSCTQRQCSSPCSPEIVLLLAMMLPSSIRYAAVVKSSRLSRPGFVSSWSGTWRSGSAKGARPRRNPRPSSSASSETVSTAARSPARRARRPPPRSGPSTR